MTFVYYATIIADNGETIERAYQSLGSAQRFVRQKLSAFDRQAIPAQAHIVADIAEVIQ